MVKIKITTYEQDRLEHFTNLMKRAQKTYNRFYKKFKDAPYLSAEAQVLSDAGRELQFYKDVVEMLENGYRKQEWISVDDGLPTWEDGKVLIYTTHGISIAQRTTSERWQGDLAKPKWITHWMPLPEPPKMKGGAE